MAAYMIVLIDMQSTDWIEGYVREVPAIMERYGGEYVAIGQAPEVVEGGMSPPSAVTLFRFPNVEAIKSFLGSEEYRPFKEMRAVASQAQILAFESTI